MSRATRSYLLLLLCSVIWGFAFVAQRLGAEDVSGGWAWYTLMVALLAPVRSRISL